MTCEADRRKKTNKKTVIYLFELYTGARLWLMTFGCFIQHSVSSSTSVLMSFMSQGRNQISACENLNEISRDGLHGQVRSGQVRSVPQPIGSSGGGGGGGAQGETIQHKSSSSLFCGRPP